MPLPIETVQRIEPARLEDAPEAISSRSSPPASATLGRALNPRTATHLAGLVRIMNTYSNSVH